MIAVSTVMYSSEAPYIEVFNGKKPLEEIRLSVFSQIVKMNKKIGNICTKYILRSRERNDKMSISSNKN